jgi:hypothetical protein
MSTRSGALRTIAVGAALILAVTAAAPVAARSVSNASGGNSTAQVVWGTGDETGAGHYGGIYGDIEDFGAIVGLWESDLDWVTCDAGTPEDPSDDYEGYIGTWVSGDGSGTVTIARDLGSATVSGTITVYHGWQDDCAQTSGTTSMEEGVTLVLDLVATGRATSDRDRQHDLLAGIYNSHTSMKSTNRPATGTAFLGGEPYPFDSGLISRNRWTWHENSR